MVVVKEWFNEIIFDKDEWVVFYIFKSNCFLKLWGVVIGKIDKIYFDGFY